MVLRSHRRQLRDRRAIIRVPPPHETPGRITYAVIGRKLGGAAAAFASELVYTAQYPAGFPDRAR
jgi:hypothetical protein